MRIRGKLALLVVATVAAFVPLGSLRADGPLDKDYVKRRTSIDDLAATGLYWLARDFATRDFSARSKELANVALELAPEARRKEIKQALAKEIKVSAPADSKLYELYAEKDVDRALIRNIGRYRKLDASLQPELKSERSEIAKRIALLKGLSRHLEEIERDLALPAAKPLQEEAEDDPAGGGKQGAAFGLAGCWKPASAAGGHHKHTEDDGPPDQAVLKRVNFYRQKAGLAGVDLDPELSEGCEKHCNYLIENAGKPEVAGLSAHEEDPRLPGATPEGARAGRHSDLAFGWGPTDSVDAWVDTIYHRTPIFNPDLKKIGVGFKDDGKHAVCALDVSDVEGGRATAKKPNVAFPAAGMAEVDTSFWGREMPNPLPSGAPVPTGYVLTLAGYRDRLEDCSATLEQNGRQVDCYFSSPQEPSPAGAMYHGNVICLIPKQALEPGKNYKVTWSYSMAGQKTRDVVTFSTAKE